MEIISYVGFNQNHYSQQVCLKKIFSKIHGFWNKQRYKNAFYSEKQKIKLNPKEILYCSARIFDFLIDNIRIICGISLFFIATITCCTFFYKNYDYFTRLSKPIILDNQNTNDIQILNELMTRFAMTENADLNTENILQNEGKEKISKKPFREPVTFQTYKVKSGESISTITKKFGLKNISTLIAINDIDNVRQLAAGQKLKIPSIDGLFYTVQKGNSLQEIATKYNVSIEDILDVNDLENSELKIGQRLFIPGATLDKTTLKNAMGELFKMPIVAKFKYSSMFGPRNDPITGASTNHKGIDMACPKGTPVLASCSGTVIDASFNNLYGNYVIIKHANGYQTLYGHLSKSFAKKGQWVSQGTRIGLVGSTGYSTGNHLHFTVYKNMKPIDPMSVIKK